MTVVTWVGNADDNDGTAEIKIGVDGSGVPVVLRAGAAKDLTEEQIKKISHKYILVSGDQSSTVVVKDQVTLSDFRAKLRGKSVTPIGR